MFRFLKRLIAKWRGTPGDPPRHFFDDGTSYSRRWPGGPLPPDAPVRQPRTFRPGGRSAAAVVDEPERDQRTEARAR